MNFKRNQELGIDLVRIERFREKKFTQNKSFYKKIFTDSEIAYCENFNDPYPHFAGKFALKEATQKSINKNMMFSNIETFYKNSKPRIRLKNSKEKYDFITSVSHESEYAIAIVLSKKEN